MNRVEYLNINKKRSFLESRSESRKYLIPLDKQLLFFGKSIASRTFLHGNKLFLSNKFSLHEKSADTFKTLSIYSFISMCLSLPFYRGLLLFLGYFQIIKKKNRDAEFYLNLYLLKMIKILKSLIKL